MENDYTRLKFALSLTFAVLLFLGTYWATENSDIALSWAIYAVPPLLALLAFALLVAFAVKRRKLAERRALSQGTSLDRIMNAPETLILDNRSDMIAHLARDRNQSNWFAVARGGHYINARLGGGVIEWMIEQPDCQNAVAFEVLRKFKPEILFATPMAELDERCPGWQLAEAVCDRAARRDFLWDCLSDLPQVDRQGYLARCLRAQAGLGADRAACLKIPKGLLAQVPTGPVPQSDWFYLEPAFVVPNGRVRR